RHRKLAVCAIVRPRVISFFRSLISILDHRAPEFASMSTSLQLSRHECRWNRVRSKIPRVLGCLPTLCTKRTKPDPLCRVEDTSMCSPNADTERDEPLSLCGTRWD